MFTFKVHSRNEEEWVANCVSSVVEFVPANEREHNRPPYKESDRWRLDNSNNWFLHKVSNTEYKLNYRYSDSEEAKRMMDSLKTYLEWRFR